MMTIKKKKTAGKERGEELLEFDSGDVLATVHLRETQGGVTYLDFTLHRSYRSRQRCKRCRSERYLSHNRDGLHVVIDQAADFVQRYQAYPELGLKEAKKLQGSGQSAGAEASKVAVDSTADKRAA